MTLILSGTDGLSDVDGSAATPAIRGTDANTGIFFPAADTIAFSEGGAEVARFDSAGNLGIGTTTITDKVTVAGNTRLVSGTLLASGPVQAGNLYYGWEMYNVNSSTNYVQGYNRSTNAWMDNVYTALSHQWHTSGSEKMRIDSSGNVGIGQSSITQAFGGYTQLNISGSSGATIQMQSGASTRTNIVADSNALYLQNISAIQFGVGGTGTGTNRMTIDANGALILVGSTAQKATGTTWSNPSDQRLKSNIQDYTKGTAELMQVRVREWEYNGKGGTTEGMKGLGVIADEVMTVLPNTVENYNAKLNADDEEITAIKKFDATEITWLLVKTVQEQQALITALTTRIEALEAK